MTGVQTCALPIFYFVWCWRRGGQTLPMKAWKLRLVRRDGRPLDTLRAVVRYAMAAAALGCSAVATVALWRQPTAVGAWVALAPGPLSIVWSFVDAEGQFLHDRLAGTRIVLASPALTASPPTTSSSPR